MNLLEKIKSKNICVGVIGLGYVGLPLLIEYGRKGFCVYGFDKDQNKIDSLQKSQSYIRHIKDQSINEINQNTQTTYTTDLSLISACDVILLALPTPLDKHHQPDLSYIEGVAEEVVPSLKQDQLVILESSTWPGTTDEVLTPILEKSGLKANQDFYIAFSPEREDPANPEFTINNIPKVVGADTDYARECAVAFYQNITTPVPVSSTRVAESAKLLENIFRSVNIALVNEMKMILDRMNIDVWEVIEAASTKPFGFMPFYPGPGLGGHCIPIDPFYLTWKAKEFDMPTRFIELAGEINTQMPYWVVQKLAEALNAHNKSLKNSHILLVGMAYKKNVDDMRETPTLKIMDILESKGAIFDYYDPYVSEIPVTRKYEYQLKSINLGPEALKKYDAALIVTDHDDVDYQLIQKELNIVIDTRNIFKKLKLNSISNIIKS